MLIYDVLCMDAESQNDYRADINPLRIELQQEDPDDSQCTKLVMASGDYVYVKMKLTSWRKVVRKWERDNHLQQIFDALRGGKS